MVEEVGDLLHMRADFRALEAMERSAVIIAVDPRDVRHLEDNRPWKKEREDIDVLTLPSPDGANN